MRYHQEFKIAGAAVGAPVKHEFRPNWLYDLDETTVGHQPMGFDQMVILYDRYNVLGAKMTVNYIGEANSAGVYTQTGFLMLTLSDYNDLQGTWSTTRLMETNVFKRKATRLIAPTESGLSGRVSLGYSQKKFFRFNKRGKDLQQMAATQTVETSDADALVRFAVWSVPYDALNNAPDMTLRITIDLIVQWTDPNDLATS